MNQPTVTLRALEPEDLDMLYRIENDRELWDVGCTNVPYSRYVLHEFIAQSTGDIYTDRQVRLIVEDSSRQTVGIVDLQNFDPQHRRAEVGVLIVSSQRRQGYACSALTQLHRYAAQTLHLHQLYGFVSASNVAATGLIRCLDYQFSEPLTDWLYDGRDYHDAFLVQKIL